MSYNEPKFIPKIIDAEYRRRKRAQRRQSQQIAPPKGRFAGVTDYTDIPTDTPWQKIHMERNGGFFPTNHNWCCPKCKYEYNSPVPPPKCICCGLPAPLFDKKSEWYLNLGR